MTPVPSRSDVSASHTGFSILPARYSPVPSALSIVPCVPPRGAAFRPLLGGSGVGGGGGAILPLGTAMQVTYITRVGSSTGRGFDGSYRLQRAEVGGRSQGPALGSAVLAASWTRTQ